MFGSNYNKNVGDLVCCVCHVVKVIELVDMSWQHCSHSQQGQDQNLLKIIKTYEGVPIRSGSYDSRRAGLINCNIPAGRTS